MSIIIQDIAQWEKTKQELGDIDTIIKNQVPIIFTDNFKKELEKDLKKALHDAFINN